MEENLSLDPIQRLPAEIFETIFPHLSWLAVQNCLCVNKEWNRRIESSKLCLSRVKLAVTKEFTTFMLSSEKPFNIQRNYQNIRVKKTTDGPEFLKFIATSQQTWKHVEIVHSDVSSRLSYFNLLKLFENTVETLKIHNTENFHPESNPEIEEVLFNFKRLKSLFMLPVFEAKVLKAIFRSSMSLNFLKIGCVNFWGHKIDKLTVLEMLNRQVNLKTLHCTGRLFEILFPQGMMINFPFQLEEIRISDLDDSVDENVFSYLKTLGNLKTIIVRGSQYAPAKMARILNIIAGLGTVKKVRSYFICSVFETFSFVQNKAVEELKLQFFDRRGRDSVSMSELGLRLTGADVSRELVQDILKSMPNLKHLRLGWIDKDLANFLVQNLKFLQTFKYLVKSDDFELEEILTDVKHEWVHTL